MSSDSQRYPIGEFFPPENITAAHTQLYIQEIAALPQAMQQAVSSLNQQQLDTPYRENGWTIRQVVHHVPDSHMNSYIRFKWALTEQQPVIKAYFEERWAELPDTFHTQVDVSLQLLTSLHQRWVVLLNSLQEADWKKGFVHPATQKTIPLNVAAGMYAWHGNHHLAHIVNLKKRMGWS